MSLTSSSRSLVLTPRSRLHGPYFALRHVSKAFGSALVLDDISFEVSRGNTLCIIDSNGAGKTILHLLMGFVKPDSGRVIAATEDITDCSPELLEPIPRKVSMVFEDGSIFRHSTIDRIQEGFQTVQGSQYQERSRETRHWRATAEALAENPEAILLDRSMAMTFPLQVHHLDVLFRRRKAEGRTSIVITEESRLVRQIADQVLFLDHGRVRFSGAVSEMTSTRRLVGLSYRGFSEPVLSLP